MKYNELSSFSKLGTRHLEFQFSINIVHCSLLQSSEPVSWDKGGEGEHHNCEAPHSRHQGEKEQDPLLEAAKVPEVAQNEVIVIAQSVWHPHTTRQSIVTSCQPLLDLRHLLKMD